VYQTVVGTAEGKKLFRKIRRKREDRLKWILKATKKARLYTYPCAQLIKRYAMKTPFLTSALVVDEWSAAALPTGREPPVPIR
jgi:hypothetical protein